MIRIDQLKRNADGHKSLEQVIASHLGIDAREIKSYEILHKSLDARKKPVIFEVYSFAVSLKNPFLEKQSVKRRKAFFYEAEKKYKIPFHGNAMLNYPPVIIGSGPAGLFAAYLLAKSGLKPIVIERGDDVEERTHKVEEFWQSGHLDPNSNVSFGEGGAGTFSDGKLNTGVKDKEGRNRYILETFVQFGAGGDILYDGKPHIGTDVLRDVVKNLRQEIIRLGGSFHFQSVFKDFAMDDGKLNSITVLHRDSGQEQVLPCECLILAIGHSARDTYLMLKEHNLPMEPKAFAVGFRMEHQQDFINRCQYGDEYDKINKNLPASPYKVTCKSSNGRGVYSFCMCPGGYIVNASSEEGELVVNGMSYAGRSGPHANSAIVVSVNPSDYGSEDALSGMYFQREMEKAAYRLGSGSIPVQYLMDYFEAARNKLGIEVPKELLNRTMDLKTEEPSMKGAYQFADLTQILPRDLQVSFVEGIGYFDKIMPGFANPDALLAGVESRTSAPVRINRDENLECVGFAGIYPCGEGCGYAGGIISAAMDGMKVAEAIIKKYRMVCER